MESGDHLEGIVADLIDILQIQAWELEDLSSRIEQVTNLPAKANSFSVTRSELAALHLRTENLRAKNGE
jgi:hypothetical protein